MRQPDDATYFPLVPGQYRIYRVQEEVKTLATPTAISTYQLKEETSQPYTDVTGQPAYRLRRYRRITDTQPWQPDSIWTARFTGDAAIQAEYGRDYVKLAWPLAEGARWNGNGLNNLEADTYESQRKDQPYRVLDTTFPATVTVMQQNDSTLVSLNRRMEVYARLVGLVYRSTVQTTYCTSAGCVGQAVVESHFAEHTNYCVMVRNKLLLLCLLGFIGLSSASYGQARSKYLILLKDKASSPYSTSKPDVFLSQRSIQRRQRQGIAVSERDLPVNPTYVTSIRQAGATVLFTSRWANAVLITATDAVLTAVKALSFVQGVEFNGPLANARIAAPQAGQRADKFGQVTDLPYGSSSEQLTQLGADVMHNQGYRGEGMMIGVLDDGFVNADQASFLQPLFAEKRVVSTYDFADHETNVYNDGEHGLIVLSTMAGQLDNQLYGTAFKASYVLVRTEVDATETPQEEAYWLLGAEYADSVGVDVINSSLGYNTFDEFPSASHTYADLTGNKTLISRAAGWAADAGIVVVVAAGNEGANDWKYILTPADSPKVLAIAAVNRVGARAYFSSYGPSADGRIKPDLAARGLSTVAGSPNGIITINGTSLASPLVAGLAAGFWQAFPNLTAAQVRDMLRRSGNQADKPDNSLGYGIPNFERAAALAKQVVILGTTETDPIRVFPNPFSDNDALTIRGLPTLVTTTTEARLTDLTGRLLWHQRVTSEQLYGLSTLRLAPGFYYLTLTTDGTRRTVKLLKQ